jgi:hypothetical protein
MNLWPQETFTSYVRDVPADAGFVYHKAATLGDKIKVDTKQNTVTYRNHPSPTNGMAPPPPPKKNCSWQNQGIVGNQGLQEIC